MAAGARLASLFVLRANPAPQTMQSIGVTGIMCDTWWGVVEQQPGQYNFTAYQQLVYLRRPARVVTAGRSAWWRRWDSSTRRS